MSGSRWLAASLLLAVSGCYCPYAYDTTAARGPPSLRAAPPHLYSRTPYYTKKLIPSQRRGGQSRVVYEPVYIDRGDGNGSSTVTASGSASGSAERIDNAQQQLRDVQGRLRDQYRQMSPEVNVDGTVDCSQARC